MTHDRDIERLVSQWLDDGPSQMPDRVIDGMADGIRHQRQRPAWRLRWKEPTMRPQALAAALAAIVILAVGGLLLLRPSSDRGSVAPPLRKARSPRRPHPQSLGRRRIRSRRRHSGPPSGSQHPSAGPLMTANDRSWSIRPPAAVSPVAPLA